jgi:hypothetical protein
MTDDLTQTVLDALADQSRSAWNAAPRTAGWLAWKIGMDGLHVSEARVKKALAPLVESGAVVAAKGLDIPWGFHGKLTSATYYMTPELQAAELKVVADAADARRWEKAADEADLALRQRFPVEWRSLQKQFYQKGAGS